jgi:hypothetical protein
MKKRIVILLFLDALFGGFLLFGQTISVEKIAASGNGVPMTALANSERREYVNVIFERDNVTAWASGGGSFSNITLTVPGHHLVPGDVFRTIGFTASGSGFINQMQCQVQSVTSTTIIAYQPQCNQSLPDSGSGTETTAILWKVGSVASGTPTNAHVKWEVTVTSPCGGGGQPACETFYLMSKDKTRIAAAGGCTNAMAVAHNPACYTSNPVLDDELSGPGIYIEFGPVQGDCTFTGDIEHSNLVLHSTVEVQVKATSKADPTKNHIEKYLVCKNEPHVEVTPGYIQIFKNFPIQLYGNIFGTALGTQPLHWSISSTDHLSGTADATITYQDSLNPVFTSGSTGGGYMVKAALQSDPTNYKLLRIWVAKTQTVPSANPDKVIQTPCEVDPVMTDYGGEVLNVGPGQTYTRLQDVPLNTGQWHWGATMILHGESAPAGSPTTFHEYFATNQPANLGPNDGTVPQFHLCGIPNSAGEMPVVDGENSTGASWLNAFSQAGATLFSFNGYSSTTQKYDGQPLKSNHVLISGIHFKNATLFTPYTLPNGTPSYYSNTSAVRAYNTEAWTVASIRTENVAMPLFGDCQANNGGWYKCSRYSYWFGNSGIAYGIAHQSTEHFFYEQSQGTYTVGNMGEGSLSGDATGMYSFRGAGQTHFAYNYLYPTGSMTTASGPGGDSENQDADVLFDPDRAFGPQGLSPAAGCSLGDTTAMWCPDPSVVYGGVNSYAWFQEDHYHTFWNYANATFMNGGATISSIAQTHDLLGLSLSANMYFYHNINRTVGNYPIINLELTRGFAPDSPSLGQPVQWPSAELQNNDLYANVNTGCSYSSCGAHEKSSSAGLENFHTNMWRTGQYTITNTNGTIGWDQGSNTTGLNNGWIYRDYTDVSPVQGHIGGWNTTDFKFSSSDPATASLRPIPSGPDVGAASPLVWPMNLYPPRFNAVDASMTWALRSDLTTIGPYDPGSGPTAVSIAVTPSSFTVAAGGTQGLTCTTTMSDSSTRSCFGPVCTSSNTAAATVSGLTVTGVSAGSGNINCGAESLTAPAVPFTVTGSGPTPVSIAITPNPITLPTGGTQVLACTTTLSNATTRSCISPACTSTNTTSATVSGLTVTATATPGTGNINCTAESLTAPSDAFTVSSGTPTVVSIAILPNPISLPPGGTQALTCTATLSNSTTRSCVSPSCTSTNTASATVSGLTVTATTTLGSGVINCSAESHTAPGDNFTVTSTAPAAGTTTSGAIGISGSLIFH